MQVLFFLFMTGKPRLIYLNVENFHQSKELDKQCRVVGVCTVATIQLIELA